MSTEFHFDALPSSEIAQKAVAVGVNKANLPLRSTFLLAVLAGVYIAAGAFFATTVATGGETLPYGVTRLLTGLAFCLGLVLVVGGNAELFTGNNLIVIAFASHKVSLGSLFRNWAVVYAGNFAGSLATAGLMFLSRQYTFGKGAVGLQVLNIASSKTSLDFIQAVALGVLCNILVCLAIWLCFGARSAADKILAIILPITAFVAAGFEHSVANMYFIPMGLMVKDWGQPDFFLAIGKTAADFPTLTLGNFLLTNLLPVTIGNIIGGAVMVGLVYWAVYLRKVD